MNKMKSAFKLLLLIVVLAGAATFVIANWSWVFAKKVKGEIINVERVNQPTAILSSRATEAQIHSYSILVKGEDGKLYTASSEDRQWQVAKPGYCVKALLYVYPPWELERAGTYFNARLEELSECPGKPITAQPQAAPVDQPPLPPPGMPNGAPIPGGQRGRGTAPSDPAPGMRELPPGLPPGHPNPGANGGVTH
jgi:hypothetical protein